MVGSRQGGDIAALAPSDRAQGFPSSSPRAPGSISTTTLSGLTPKKRERLGGMPVGIARPVLVGAQRRVDGGLQRRVDRLRASGQGGEKGEGEKGASEHGKFQF